MIFRQMSFRKKIILSQLICFIAFFLALFPFVEKTASILIRDSLIESTGDLISLLEKAKTEEEMIALLKAQEYYAFFRMTIINDKGLVIYDTHLERLMGKDFRPYYPTEHGELKLCQERRVGYVIATSESFKGKFAYVAELFNFHGKNYILRTAFPYQQVQDLTENFELGILILSFLILLIFNLLIWFIFNRFTRPIREIIRAIIPYQQGELAQLPNIALSKTAGPHDDFQLLANALNSLSRQIQEQIDHLKAERNEKEAILESLGEGVIAVNEKMLVLYINFIACKMLGINRRTILNKPMELEGEKINRLLMEKCKDLLLRCQEQKTILTDSFSIGKDRKTYIDLIAAPKAQGTGAIIVLQDKTSHYRVLEMGKDFIANASHELRTPITIIKGYAETLHEMPQLSREQIKEIIAKIERNCERMENLVKNLLTLTDIENLPESRFKECDLPILLENCKHFLLSVHPNSQIDLDVPDHLHIAADSDLLELAFMNLLENAIKYSIPPAKIQIRVESDEEEVNILIKDQGKGIPPEDLDHIFERFYRVDKTHSRKLGGAGLGLSIVKRIITKHDGTIRVSSKLGKGTTFIITLPLRHHTRM